MGPLPLFPRYLVASSRRIFRSFLEEIDIQPARFIESGDWVVVPNTGLVRGRDGIQTIARSTFAFELHGGLITRIRLYQETQEALETLGLSE